MAPDRVFTLTSVTFVDIPTVSAQFPAGTRKMVDPLASAPEIFS